ncbi:hypothetical protein BRADI_1g57717v3 [Brachypodium distachyon]|uniref:Uncharacterized protein n=1 Tax=Brachypodium distachyon TaxID=15368 RepID=A0A2K2DS42_BRADI|nr:hypothetical protein BRADI_1g57717v3 [Brachypodium distachyon]
MVWGVQISRYFFSHGWWILPRIEGTFVLRLDDTSAVRMPKLSCDRIFENSYFILRWTDIKVVVNRACYLLLAYC